MPDLQKPLDTVELHRVADKLITRASVTADELVEIGQAYLELQEELEGIRARAGRRGPQPAPPHTEDGRLVARVMELKAKATGQFYRRSNLGKDLGCQRSMLARCNSKVGAVALPAPVREALLKLKDQLEAALPRGKNNKSRNKP